ncbi:MAG: sugar-binding domain-containing protein [Aminivibrio sp.]|uniref:sugar-binding domain-containing protein n=1 Tax=Aminivibrio sp. TaxID=1872489 RepID=UPI002B1F7FC0|nr:sugar-binding domain-containing protein [Aminivibrio sp.]MEA4952689.1 sugar-binding domain-containing protein [Aminivibrio sp.]
MVPDEKKLKRLTAAAKMYYRDNMLQSEIAGAMGISRPMVSRLLAEAREFGVVTITINEAGSAQQILAERLAARFSLKRACVVPSRGSSPADGNGEVVRRAFTLWHDELEDTVFTGVGCGYMVGLFSEYTGSRPSEPDPRQGEVFPLIGGIKASFRSYHTNELVRLIAAQSGMKASYLYMPALFDSEDEKGMYEQTEAYREIESRWNSLETAVIGISNLHASPDLATAARFGRALTEERAVGRILAHYYDMGGRFIEPRNDIAVQISLPRLRAAKNVVALCADYLTPESLLGALRTGIITHLVLPDTLADQAVQAADPR